MFRLKFLLTLLVTTTSVLFTHPNTVLAQEAADQPTPSQEIQSAPAAPEFIRGRVVEIVKEEEISTQPEQLYVQELKVSLENSDNSEPVNVSLGSTTNPISKEQLLTVNQEVIMVKQTVGAQQFYQIVEVYRLHYVLYLVAAFFILILFISGRKGIGAIAGLLLSGLVIMNLIVPQILAGTSAILITIIGGLIIMTGSLYLAHGFNRRTTISIVGTGLTLALVGFISSLVVSMFQLTGLGTDEALFLQMGADIDLNLQGLLLSGIMIGTLGVLDDITTSQTAIVHELHRTDPKLSSQELYKRGLNVGREHIASLVNTLVLAYAGAALPLFMLFHNNTYYPMWVSLNFEFIIEEIVRTVLGSMGLILAVPITTFLAAVNVPQSNTNIPTNNTYSPHNH